MFVLWLWCHHGLHHHDNAASWFVSMVCYLGSTLVYFLCFSVYFRVSASVYLVMFVHMGVVLKVFVRSLVFGDHRCWLR